MPKHTQLKYVWPKDGPKGRGRRGFFGRLNDILTGRGPDIFLDKESSTRPIKADHWGNWDSYHYYGYHLDELTSPFQNKLWSASRGLKRYDPHTRRYRQWHLPHDWHDQRLGPQGEPNYPRFTWDESVRMLRRLRRGHSVDATRMGKEWHHEGPRRFNYEYDWFWQEAHRVGENMRQGFRRQSAVNPNLRMHQNYPNDLDDWVYREFI